MEQSNNLDISNNCEMDHLGNGNKSDVSDSDSYNPSDTPSSEDGTKPHPEGM